ncbi:NACHT, LRR and PYD domains-containing protein 14-like isoform X2 [Clavelina lepadiformis]|uniref:NACHT, LRR and PYD domains-containing protein 14-like isoform X2 n=1 Tax=Clavelina lepadiformis TaxID=159417 RepID=UPI004041BF52
MQDHQDANTPSTSGPLASPSGKIQVDQSSNKRQVDQSHANLSNFTGVMNTGDMTVHGDVIITTGHAQPNTEQPSSAPGESAENLTMRLEEELSSKLKERAEIVAGQMNLPVDIHKRIDSVPLEIARWGKRMDLDNVGHYHKRADVLERFDPGQGNITLDQVYESSKDNAINEARYRCKTPAAKEEYVRIHGNIVGVSGQAGIGKTTLTKILTKKILKEGLLSEIKYIFYIALRDVDFTAESNLLQFFTTSTGCEWDHSREFHDRYLLIHLNESSDVIIIMDGLDEARMTSPDKLAPITSLHSEGTAETFIKNLLRGKLLPRAKKFITSRPRQLYDLHPECRPSFIVNVLGLNEESQKKICGQICDKDSEKVMQKLDNNPDISSYCYIPVLCILTIHCIHQSMSKGEDTDLSSMTGIICYALEMFIRSSHMHGHESDVGKLARLAWNGFATRKIIFSENDLKDVDMDEKTIRSFLKTNVGSSLKVKIFEGDKKTFFSHLVWQETFVAIYLVFFASLNEFESSMSSFETPRYEIVAKFVFGLCHDENVNRLMKFLPPPTDYDGKKKMMKEFLVLSTPSSVNDEDSSQRLLVVCAWLKEANDQDFNEAVASVVRSPIVLQRANILPNDVTSFNYFLRSTTEPCVVRIDEPSFSGDSFDRLFTELGITQKKNQVKIDEINLSGNKFGDDGALSLSKCLHNIRRLDVHDCNIGDVGVKSLSETIEHLPQPIDEINLSWNKFGDDGALSLSKCLHNIRRLDVHSCNIGDVGVKSLSEAIEHLPQPIDEINLSENEFGDDGALSLLKCLHNIRRLNLWNCNIGDVEVKSLSEVIEHLPQPIDEINLCGNKFGDDGALSLSKCLHNIRRLDVGCCDIGDVGVKSLSEAIEHLPQPIDEINLSRNKFGDDGALSLSKCLHNIRRLDVHSCNIGDVGVKSLSEAIEHLPQPIDEINLSGNMFGDDGALSLSKCLHNIRRLHVWDCNIGDVGVKSLSEAIKHLPQPKPEVEGVDLVESSDDEELVSSSKSNHE